MPETIRVLRILEYSGPRALVEETISRSIHGKRTFVGQVTVHATTLGECLPERHVESLCKMCGSSLSSDVAATCATNNEECWQNSVPPLEDPNEGWGHDE